MRRGFALVEVVVALLVFTIGALGATALTIHAAAQATRAHQAELAAWRAASLVRMLDVTGSTTGTLSDRVAHYSWTVGAPPSGAIEVVAVTRAGADTIRLQGGATPALPLLRAAP